MDVFRFGGLFISGVCFFKCPRCPSNSCCSSVSESLESYATNPFILNHYGSFFLFRFDLCSFSNTIVSESLANCVGGRMNRTNQITQMVTCPSTLCFFQKIVIEEKLVRSKFNQEIVNFHRPNSLCNFEKNIFGSFRKIRGCHGSEQAYAHYIYSL